MIDPKDDPDCRHPHTVIFRWLGHDGPVVQRLCDTCGAAVWAAMPQPIRETFSCEPIS